MHGLLIPILSATLLTACGSSISSVDDIVSVCHHSTSIQGCKELDKKSVTIRGFLIENEYVNRPHLISKITDLANFDLEKDDFPLSIELLASQLDYTKYEKFLGQEVVITGQIYTECPPKAAKILEEQSNNKDSDTIIVHMLTGTCHYVTNPHMNMSEVNIRSAS